MRRILALLALLVAFVPGVAAAQDSGWMCPYSPNVDCGNDTCCPGGSVCCTGATGKCCPQAQPFCCPGGSSCVTDPSQCESSSGSSSGGGSGGSSGSSSSGGKPYGENGGHEGGYCPGFVDDGGLDPTATCAGGQYCCPRFGVKADGSEGYCCALGSTCCRTYCDATDPSCPGDQPPSASHGGSGGCIAAGPAGNAWTGLIVLGALGAMAARRKRSR